MSENENEESETLTIKAVKVKDTKRYTKYLTITNEDPPEFIPAQIYVGAHIANTKKIVIELEDKGNE